MSLMPSKHPLDPEMMRRVKYMIIDLSWLEDYQALFSQFAHFLTPYEFVLSFASVPFERDYTENLYEMFHRHNPAILHRHLDTIDLIVDTIIEEYYARLEKFLIYLGLPTENEYLLIRMFDRTSGILKVEDNQSGICYG